MNQSQESTRNWQLQHYANVGAEYGHKHFTQPDSPFTTWILGQIASVSPDQVSAIAEVGAGTCVFASSLGRLLEAGEKVVCYEPVAELLEGATSFDNVRPVCGGALEFAAEAPDNTFDLVFTKDTAHHFPTETLDTIHEGFCRKLASGGRYVLVSRTPPDSERVPVGTIAAAKWPELYTSLEEILASMRRVPDWTEIQTVRWEQSIETEVEAWLDGVRSQDTWSVFSALNQHEIEATIDELKKRFANTTSFPFLHQYDVAVFQKSTA